MDAIIRLQNVVKTYDGALGRETVLENFHLDIERANFVAVMGPSGVGKTTLLNLIAGLDRPDAGAVIVDGTHIDALKQAALTRWRAAHVGFVFQSPFLLPMLSALDNVALPLMLTRLPRAERKRRSEEALARVGLAGRSAYRPGQLSGGQQQRAGLARAIVTGAPILLCDEPTAGLDRPSADSVLELLRRFTCEGRTIVMVTHDSRAADAADRCLQLAVAA